MHSSALEPPSGSQGWLRYSMTEEIFCSMVLCMPEASSLALRRLIAEREGF